MNEPVVQLDAIDFQYEPGRPVLQGCDVQLLPGQRIGIAGHNGCGKTTLLHLIVGLLRPTAGRVVIFGQERRREADFHEVRQRVGLLFEDADDQLFCPTVAEDVAFGPLNQGKARGEVRTIVAETLGQLGLAGFESRLTHHLSGGEKRLVALATVLAMRPDVLLLDEPTTGLEPDTVTRLVQLLNGLPQAMLLISHDPAFLEATAQQHLRLTDGRLVDRPSRD
ncbi:MAG: ABC transporter ATP-binding protein [Pirellulales bacterium]|nr:ABC transporter ATP-binding protein [Pirellulales bacterium]